MEKVKTDHLVALAANTATKYNFDKPDREILEVFNSPMPPSFNIAHSTGKSSIAISSPEFTSLCPLTGQPDFATIIIEYQPNKLCVESKSLKLYLMSFRNHGEFHEACVTRIFDDLWHKLSPQYLKVQGQFTPRGGIPFWPTVERWDE